MIYDSGAYYTYDHKGSVVNIANESVSRDYKYNAFGKDKSEADAEVYGPYGYCGEYTDYETGYIYLRNRYYNPEIGRFITEDPARDGLNWYVYCANNPIMYVDPWGLKPTKEEAAYMAEHIYDCKETDSREKRTVAGWRLIDVLDGGAASSIKVGVYIPDEDDWTNPSEYALVFRGSTTDFDTLETWQVWANNLLAYGTSCSIDMWAAIKVGRYFDNEHSQEITFIGHSKGGGEAIAAATATNNNAITFNAANFKFFNYGLFERNKSGIINYYVDGEVLSSAIGKSIYGTNITIATQYWKNHKIAFIDYKTPDSIKNHGMDAFGNAWELEW